MNYTRADKAIKELNRYFLRRFGRLKQLRFDALNILQDVDAAYDMAILRKKYLEIAWWAYRDAMIEAGKTKEQAERDADDSITNDWFLDMIEEYDPVAQYIFKNERERKKQRLLESIVGTHNKNAPIDKALRLWALQYARYADKSVDDATLDAYEDAGIEKVMWVATHDKKLCSVCAARDGKIYPISKVPPKAHYHCRCRYVPVP